MASRPGRGILWDLGSKWFASRLICKSEDLHLLGGIGDVTRPNGKQKHRAFVHIERGIWSFSSSQNATKNKEMISFLRSLRSPSHVYEAVLAPPLQDCLTLAVFVPPGPSLRHLAECPDLSGFPWPNLNDLNGIQSYLVTCVLWVAEVQSKSSHQGSQ